MSNNKRGKRRCQRRKGLWQKQNNMSEYARGEGRCPRSKERRLRRDNARSMRGCWWAKITKKNAPCAVSQSLGVTIHSSSGKWAPTQCDDSAMVALLVRLASAGKIGLLSLPLPGACCCMFLVPFSPDNII
jgi:hypothetical protein